MSTLKLSQSTRVNAVRAWYVQQGKLSNPLSTLALQHRLSRMARVLTSKQTVKLKSR